MFYNLLSEYANHSHIANLFCYISFRCCLACLCSFLIMMVLGRPFIAYLKLLQKNGQPIRHDGPQTHLKKAGTPTMGGVLILASSFIATFLFADLANPYIWIILSVMISFGALGVIDDYKKVTRNNTKGVSGRCKLLFQFLISSLAFVAICYFYPRDDVTQLAVPFVKYPIIELGYFYLPFAMIVITGSSNAVNLTDGLDGLAAGTIAIATAAFGLIAYLIGHAVYAHYLHIIHVPQASEIAILACAIIGSCLGFLWFNAKPADVFMGDTGSLALGAVLGTISVITKNELVLVVIGGIFVIETLSVIIQVWYFKRTGQRVFLMAPIHHHFEQKGWSETQVVTRFIIIAILLAMIGLASLKLR